MHAPDASGWVTPAHLELASALGFRHLGECEYYECRLQGQLGAVDYLVGFARSTASAASSQLRELSERARGGASWAPLLELVEAWADKHSLLGTRVPTLWLEFDGLESDEREAEALCPREPALALPSVSLCLVPGYRTDRALAPDVEGRGLALVREVLARLEGAAEPARVAPAAEREPLLARCFAALPDGARWIHVSVMLGREPCALKLYGSLPRGGLLAYLREVGFAGDLAAIGSLLEHGYGPALAGDEVLVDVNLDNFRDARRCTLGLALGQQHLSLDGTPDRARALARWVQAGWCAPEKAELARRWLEGAAGERCLDLKLVWQARGGPVAKAYLGLHPGAAASARASRTSGGSSARSGKRARIAPSSARAS